MEPMRADDRLAILDAMGRYAYAWDTKDAEAYSELFVEDGVLEVHTRSSDGPAIHCEGRVAVRAWAERIHSGSDPGMRPIRPGQQTRHTPNNTIFDSLSDTEARTRTMLLEMLTLPGQSPTPQVTGIYTDVWRRTPAGWLITHRRLDMDGG